MCAPLLCIHSAFRIPKSKVQLEPGADQSNPSGKALIAAKKKHHTCLPRRINRVPHQKEKPGAAQAGRPPQEQAATHQDPAEGRR